MEIQFLIRSKEGKEIGWSSLKEEEKTRIAGKLQDRAMKAAGYQREGRGEAENVLKTGEEI